MRVTSPIPSSAATMPTNARRRTKRSWLWPDGYSGGISGGHEAPPHRAEQRVDPGPERDADRHGQEPRERMIHAPGHTVDPEQQEGVERKRHAHGETLLPQREHPQL